MKFIFNIIIGILIGAGAILPGISSGVMCVIFGIYENLIDRILNFFKKPLENFKFFLPYIIGGLIGIFLIGNLLLFLFNTYYNITCFIFIGLILGCIPSILKQTNKDISNKFLHILLLFLTLTFSIYLITLKFNHINNDINNISNLNLGISGFFMSAGVIIPGVSSSAILMIMNIYETYLTAITTINLKILIPLGIGLILGCYLFLKIINFLFKNFKSYTYYAIIGFTIGSIFVIFPTFNFNIEGIIGIVLFVSCFLISNFLSKLEIKQ